MTYHISREGHTYIHTIQYKTYHKKHHTIENWVSVHQSTELNYVHYQKRSYVILDSYLRDRHNSLTGLAIMSTLWNRPHVTTWNGDSSKNVWSAAEIWSQHWGLLNQQNQYNIKKRSICLVRFYHSKASITQCLIIFYLLWLLIVLSCIINYII